MTSCVQLFEVMLEGDAMDPEEMMDLSETFTGRVSFDFSVHGLEHVELSHITVEELARVVLLYSNYVMSIEEIKQLGSRKNSTK